MFFLVLFTVVRFGEVTFFIDGEGTCDSIAANGNPPKRKAEDIFLERRACGVLWEPWALPRWKPGGANACPPGDKTKDIFLPWLWGGIEDEGVDGGDKSFGVNDPAGDMIVDSLVRGLGAPTGGLDAPLGPSPQELPLPDDLDSILAVEPRES